MNQIEVIALIVASFATIKLIFITLNPKFWFNNIAKKFWSNPKLASFLAIIAGGIVLAILLQNLTIVQIFASMLFVISLLVIGFAPFSKDMLKLIENKILNKNTWKRSWLSIIIWIILIIWLFYEIFV